ncbi:MAG: microcystin degradation protein MlrC, partial [Candidatus Paceibacteria bacterium]
RLRAVIGPELPIAVTLDPHANVTQAMCDQANILLSFTSYPHVDMRTTGRRAAELLHQTMQGEIKPRTLCVRRPMLEEVNGGRTDIGPMIDRHTKARAYETQRDIFAISINGGFASADISEVGPTVLVTYQGEVARPLKIANELADDIWGQRHQVLNDYLTAQAAADIAAGWGISDGPLVIADYADNPGAGAYGDSTSLLERLLAAKLTDACFGPLVDAQAVRTLSKSTIGARVQISIGGHTAPDFGGGPIEVEGTIMWQGEGLLTGDGPILGGLERDYGPTAVLRVGGVDILIVTIPDQMRDLQQFRTFGIDPAKMRVVALKSMQHFRAAFEPIAGKIIVCDSGALCTTQYNLLPYENVPRPIFPLDEI